MFHPAPCGVPSDAGTQRSRPASGPSGAGPRPVAHDLRPSRLRGRWSRPPRNGARRCAARCRRAASTARWAAAPTAAGADVVLLCVPDAEIAAAAALHRARAARRPLLRRDDARAAAAPATRRFCLHPLMTVTARGADFAGAHAAVAGSDAARPAPPPSSSPRALGHDALRPSPTTTAPPTTRPPRSPRTSCHARVAPPSASATPASPRAARPARARHGRELGRRGRRAARSPARSPAATRRPSPRQRAAVAERAPELLGLFDALAAATRELARRAGAGMRTLRTVAELRARSRRAAARPHDRARPDDGRLHDGHLALIRARPRRGRRGRRLAVRQPDAVQRGRATSTPTRATRPRDAALAAERGRRPPLRPGAPTRSTRPASRRTVRVAGPLTETLEGAHRGAGHFHGVDDRRHQAAEHGRARRRLLRPEGRPAGAGHPAAGRATSTCPSRIEVVPDRARARRPGAVVAATCAWTTTTAQRALALTPRAARRRGTRVAAGERDAAAVRDRRPRRDDRLRRRARVPRARRPRRPSPVDAVDRRDAPRRSPPTSATLASSTTRSSSRRVDRDEREALSAHAAHHAQVQDPPGDGHRTATCTTSGSITIDPDLLEAADILEHEQVHVVDVDNGARFETYTIAGERGSGAMKVNGAAARLVHRGDTIIVISYGQYDEADLERYEPKRRPRRDRTPTPSSTSMRRWRPSSRRGRQPSQIHRRQWKACPRCATSPSRPTPRACR